MLTNTYIKGRNWTKDKAEQEEGEMASWLILGAALASIALGLRGIIEPIIQDLASQVGGGG